MTLLIRKEDVEKVLSFEEAIEAVEDAYRQYGLGLSSGNSLLWGCPTIPRIEMRVEGKGLPHGSPQIRGIWGLKAAYLEETGNIYLRWGFNLGKDKKTAYMSYLIDARNGEILAIFKESVTMAYRLGATGAVGAKYLSRKDSRIAGVIGTGRVGKLQLHFLTKVRNIEEVLVYSLCRRKDLEYIRDMGDKLGIDIMACDGPEEVVRKADILVTATNATTPIVKGEWVDEGLHITAVGADCPLKAELDASTLKKADKLVIDYEASMDTKELRVPMEQGILKMEDIYGNIGEVVAGVKSGRETPSEITIYKNTGTNIPYPAIHTKVYEKVKEKDLGAEVDKAFIDLLYS